MEEESDAVLRRPRKEYPVVPCSECGRPFEQLRVNHTYCTKRCTLKAGGRRRQRDEYRVSEAARENMRQAQRRRRQKAEDSQ